MTCKDPPISTTHDRDVALLLATLAEISALTGLTYQPLSEEVACPTG